MATNLTSIELNNIDRAIRDTEIRLQTSRITFMASDREVRRIEEAQEQLKENIACLKEKNLTVSILQYKNARDDFKKLELVYVIARNNRENSKKIVEAFEKNLTELKLRLDEHAHKMDNNVIYAKFGKKDG